MGGIIMFEVHDDWWAFLFSTYILTYFVHLGLVGSVALDGCMSG